MSAKVTLLTYTPMPEQTIASAARLCYSSGDIDSVRSKITDEKAASFVEMLAQIGHESPIEHASFTFGIEGVSRSLLAQITRHRIASFSVQSQRYVNENMFEYVIPPYIEQDPVACEIYKNSMTRAQNDYNALADILAKSHKERLVSEGLDEQEAEKKAEKTAIEDARFVLPNACCTKMICTFNARSLLNFFAHRCCNRAQWEIRDVAEQMLALCKQVAPAVFKNAGPSCIRGNCPEGKMSCGKSTQVREKYSKL
ncbi:MAG: FAD-dependent thymidylate synthase [Acutalibacteraceae bacterium]